MLTRKETNAVLRLRAIALETENVTFWQGNVISHCFVSIVVHSAKIAQMSEIKKMNAFFFISECSLYYERIVQMNEIKGTSMFYMPFEKSLTYGILLFSES